MNKSFKKLKWIVDHRNDGQSFMAIPFDYKDGTIKYHYVIGPLDKEIIEWLNKAVGNYQIKLNKV